MRWILIATSAAIAAGLWLPGEAAQPEPGAVSAAVSTAPAAAGGNEAITFEQYRDWRLKFNERRRAELAIQLEDASLPAPQKGRVARVKAYYDGLVALSEAERDARFRQRFDQIDTNHDGTIDAGERAAWRDKRRALYRPEQRTERRTERKTERPLSQPADIAATAN